LFVTQYVNILAKSFGDLGHQGLARPTFTISCSVDISGWRGSRLDDREVLVRRKPLVTSESSPEIGATEPGSDSKREVCT